MMNRLRQTLMAFMQTLHPRVFYQVAPTSALYPYLVFDFVTALDDGEGFRDVEVDVDVWGVENDTSALEELVTRINTHLNKKTLSTDDLSATFYLDRILSLTDDSPSLRRRRLIYQAHVYGGS